MKYIETNWDIPYYNMAFENYIMNRDDLADDFVFFYIHKPSIIVGKHQNTYAEINQAFVDARNVIVSRRISGGGAVYHDKGNLNFSFIFNRKKADKIDFKTYTMPVIKALKKLGIESELSGRNDILIEGKKFSGNAQLMNKTKVLHHGTLMFDVVIEDLIDALNVSQLKIESKAIESVRSRVANLKDYLSQDMTIREFKDHLIKSFYEEVDFEEYVLTAEDIEAVEKSVQETFSTWEYNYGRSPDFAIVKKKRYDAGIVEAHLNVSEGCIQQIKIYGDFFFTGELGDLEGRLVGLRYNEEDIRKHIDEIDLNRAILNLSLDELVDLLLK